MALPVGWLATVGLCLAANWIPASGSASKWANWKLGLRASEDELVHPIFMLRHDKEKLAAFEQTLLSLSTPGSPRYGQYLSRDEVAAQLPPMPGAQESVVKLLAELRGLVSMSTSATGDMLEATMTVGAAEELFQVHLHHFTSEILGADVIRSASPAVLPTAVREKVYVVGNLDELPGLRHAQVVDDPSSGMEDAPTSWPEQCKGCKNQVTPAVLQQVYGIPDPPANQNSSMAVAEFGGQDWDQAALTYFQQKCALKTHVTVDTQVGPNSGLKCRLPLVGSEVCMESLLDIEYIKGVAGDIHLTDIQNNKYSLLNWAKQIDDMEAPPLVHSVSYGDDEVQQVSTDYMSACNVQFMKLGSRGLSILIASGDQGVWGRTGATTAFGGDGSKFHPDFPASSPYVTAVGGTDFAVKSSIGAEMAWDGSGGGFSNHFAAPSYQLEALAGYTKAAVASGVLPSQEYWNATGRGYPDISALGGTRNTYCVAATRVIGTGFLGVAGTSASTPVVAAIFARMNGLRAAKGMPPMGFLNPFIYQNGDAFNDVTLGTNSGDGPKGFSALAGWDPATGFGTPSFPKIAAAALKATAHAADSRAEIVV